MNSNNQTPADNPYNNSSANIIYNLLFCDDLDSYKQNAKEPYTYPMDILFAENSSIVDLQKIIDDENSDPRIKVLACNKFLSAGHKPAKKELFAVIVEIGLDGGLDVLASFSNGTARYINQAGKILIWESPYDTTTNDLTRDLFDKGRQIIARIGPWDKTRKAHPVKGITRITFLVSDGLYFGEGPTTVLFNDSFSGPALLSATKLLQYLTQKVV